jgi:hypothetical protein
MSVFRSLSILALAIAATLGVAGGVAWSRSGEMGLAAAIVAAGVCWVGAALSFVLVEWFRRSGNPVAGVLGGMLIRLGLPLAVGVALSEAGGPLADAGVFGLIVVFYLVALVVETLLLVRALQQPRRPAPSA